MFLLIVLERTTVLSPGVPIYYSSEKRVFLSIVERCRFISEEISLGIEVRPFQGAG